jgi:tripartite-type tricarboxylate transporter receptor subunit TctC
MHRRLVLRSALLLASATVVIAPVQAQAPWPDRPIRFVVPFPPGGSSDLLGRIVAEGLAKQLDATVVVENKPGATTQIGTELVSQAAPDGYTVLLGAATSFTVLPHMRKLNYSIDSFEAIGGVADYLAILAVRNTLPVTTIDQFIAYAREHPGLSYGSAGEASFGHIAGGALARYAKLDFLHVPFRGSADAVNGTVAGDVDFTIDGAAVPMAKAGRLRPLVTFSDRRHPELPDLPSLKDAGLNVQLSQGSGWGLLVPKGTPQPIVDRLSKALEALLSESDARERIQRANAIVHWQTPQVFRDGLAADRKFYGELLPAIGVKVRQ